MKITIATTAPRRARVVTYALPYVQGCSVDLCDRCAEDPAVLETVVLGQVEHGSHLGTCEGRCGS